jgi:hypothetical protein
MPLISIKADSHSARRKSLVAQNQGGTAMPADVATVISAVTVVFVLFALVLAWGNRVSG